MLDTKKVGIKISALRKGIGLSQEKLADLLHISPQAISKWENGHTLPETTLLPVLSQIFQCTIDDLLIPAYAFDEKIEAEKPTLLEQQAEYIAKYVIRKMDGETLKKEDGSIDDETIINAIYTAYPNIGYCTVKRGRAIKKDGNSITSILVSSPQKELKLYEKYYGNNDTEIYNFKLIASHTAAIPRIYFIDLSKKVILLEDLTDDFIQGFDFDEDNENGKVIRKHYHSILLATAKFHMDFWENKDVFELIGMDRRLKTRENILAHISCLEDNFNKYRNDEEAGKIPKVWMNYLNKIELKKLEYFEDAIRFLKVEYPKLLESRFDSNRNITIVHGDLHPGQILMSKEKDRTIKFIGLQALRIGLCTEDLAMLITLHLEPDKMNAKKLFTFYYQCLCEKVKNYSFDTFMNDFKISVAESMFFTLKLINSGIYDFNMRDNSLKAYESFFIESNECK